MNTIKWSVLGKKKSIIPIKIGTKIHDPLRNFIAKQSSVDRCIVLYDKDLHIFAEKTMQTLQCSGIALPSGEDSKSITQVTRIIEDLTIKQATSHTIVVIIGGGMACDTGSFIASIYRYGIRHILLPTNLLAMTDAAIGGKTAINIGKLKNIIGTYHYPIATFIELDLLSSLPSVQMHAGLVEIIKLAAMCDAELFGWLEENIDRIIQKEMKALQICIEKSIGIKQQVCTDELFTKPQLSATNFGHTIGHCLESLSHFSISHTEAVSIGMCLEMNITQCGEAKRIINLLNKLDQPLHIPLTIRTQQVWDILKSHQPNAQTITICTPDTIGTHSCKEMNFSDLIAQRE